MKKLALSNNVYYLLAFVMWPSSVLVLVGLFDRPILQAVAILIVLLSGFFMAWFDKANEDRTKPLTRKGVLNSTFWVAFGSLLLWGINYPTTFDRFCFLLLSVFAPSLGMVAVRFRYQYSKPKIERPKSNIQR